LAEPGSQQRLIQAAFRHDRPPRPRRWAAVARPI